LARYAESDWTICYQDPASGQLTNHWISLHEIGIVAGYFPVLVLDAWEHAFILDYKPADRAKYIEAFFTKRRLERSRLIERRLQPGSSHAA